MSANSFAGFLYFYITFKSLMKKNFLYFLFFITFFIFNVFFYSFITISLYKLICYEANTLTSILSSIYSIKDSFVFFNFSNNHNIFLFGTYWYDLFIPFSYVTNISYDFTFFYNIIKDNNLSSFLFLFDNNSSYTDNYNLIFLNFYIRASNMNWIQSISLQKTIILNLNETGLFFFRIYNPSHLNVKLVTLYMIYPSIITLYVNKVQCFCFNLIFLYPLELVDLPVLIYIHPFLSIWNNYINNIIIYYIIFLN